MLINIATKYFMLIVLAVLMGACGGGDGGDGDGGDGDITPQSESDASPTTPTQPSPGIPNTNFVHFFIGDGEFLKGVDSNDPTNPVVLDHNPVSYARTAHITTAGVVIPEKFIFNAGGKIYSTPVGGNGSLTQLSNATSSMLCNTQMISDNTHHLFYRDGGATGGCNLGTGPWYVNDDMNSTAAPVAAPGFPLTTILDANEQISGWLMPTPTGFDRRDRDFNLVASIPNFSPHKGFRGAAGILLIDDTDIHHFDETTNTIGASLLNYLYNSRLSYFKVTDTHLYFVEDDLNLYRVNLDGSANAVLIGSEGASTRISNIYLISGDYILYETFDSMYNSLKTMRISDGSVNTLVNGAPIDPRIYYNGFNDGVLFYNVLVGYVGGAEKINLDGTGKTIIANALWAGGIYDPVYNITGATYELNNLHLIENINNTMNLNDTNLALYDVAGTTRIRNLGYLPDDMTIFPGYNWFSLQSEAIAVASFDDFFNHYSDVLYFDINTENSLVKVTNDMFGERLIDY